MYTAVAATASASGLEWEENKWMIAMVGDKRGKKMGWTGSKRRENGMGIWLDRARARARAKNACEYRWETTEFNTCKRYPFFAISFFHSYLEFTHLLTHTRMHTHTARTSKQNKNEKEEENITKKQTDNSSSSGGSSNNNQKLIRHEAIAFIYILATKRGSCFVQLNFCFCFALISFRFVSICFVVPLLLLFHVVEFWV